MSGDLQVANANGLRHDVFAEDIVFFCYFTMPYIFTLTRMKGLSGASDPGKK